MKPARASYASIHAAALRYAQERRKLNPGISWPEALSEGFKEAWEAARCWKVCQDGEIHYNIRTHAMLRCDLSDKPQDIEIDVDELLNFGKL